VRDNTTHTHGMVFLSRRASLHPLGPCTGQLLPLPYPVCLHTRLTSADCLLDGHTPVRSAAYMVEAGAMLQALLCCTLQHCCQQVQLTLLTAPPVFAV
jgi:hypothetical protein